MRTKTKNRLFCLLACSFLGLGQATMLLEALPAFSEPAADKQDSTEAAPSSNGSASGESWRKTPPKLPQPKVFKLPEIQTFKLKNGLNVQMVEDHKVPFTTFALGIRAGVVNDPSKLEGLSALVARMLSEGTEKRSSKQIAEDIEFIGGALSASAGQDFTIVAASALSQYNQRLLDIVADVIQKPNFPQDELKLKKENLIQELVIRRSKPDFLAGERFSKELYGEHPYSVVAPEPETIKKITRDDLLSFYKQFFLPNISDIVVVGDFKAAEMKVLIEEKFASWAQGKAPGQQTASLPEPGKKRILLVHRPDSVQSKIKMGNVGIKRSDPDFYALTVANQILGGAATSRLFTNIRENKGYTYGAYSHVLAQKQAGPVSAEAEVRTEVTSPAVQEFLYEIQKMRNLKPQDKELADAKNFLVGSFQLGLESQSGLATRLLEGELFGLPADYLEKYSERIMAVNPDDVRTVARRHIKLDNLVITVVGDAEKIKSDLEYFAPVSVYDTSGALVKSVDSGSGKSGKSAGGS